ncbi:MAG: hypothetical protein S4CHLAM20_06530 [Chlamydiia bacterium]|nr:hypothetical protein [Chlamydiia bacterium]
MRLKHFIFLFPFFLFGNISVITNSTNLCVMNAETGNVIYQKNMHQKIYPGSVTKVATALYLIEECEIDEEYVVTCMKEPLVVTTEQKKVESNFTLPGHILENDGVTIYLKNQERLKLKDLFYAMMIKSANDASNVIASVYDKTIPDFMFKVNKFLRQLGCRDTHFVNPHGLHHPDHVTTPYDLAIIMKKASSHPYLKKLMSTTDYLIPKTNLSSAREIKTFNKLMRKESRYYTPSVTGVKTGYHHRARYNIALAAEKDGRAIIVAINKSQSSKTLYDDCRKLLDAVFDEKPKERLLFNAKESKFHHEYEWGNQKLTASLKENCLLSYYPSEEEPVDVKLHWIEKDSPIKAGDVVATIDIYNQAGAPLMQQAVYAENSVGVRFGKKVAFVVNTIIRFTASYPLSSIAFILLIGLFIRSRRRKKIV